jgi:hypothetical protein
MTGSGSWRGCGRPMPDRDQLRFDSYDLSDPDPSHRPPTWEEELYFDDLEGGADEVYQLYWRPGLAAKRLLEERER